MVSLICVVTEIVCFLILCLLCHIACRSWQNSEKENEELEDALATLNVENNRLQKLVKFWNIECLEALRHVRQMQYELREYHRLESLRLGSTLNREINCLPCGTMRGVREPEGKR